MNKTLTTLFSVFMLVLMLASTVVASSETYDGLHEEFIDSLDQVKTIGSVYMAEYHSPTGTVEIIEDLHVNLENIGESLHSIQLEVIAGFANEEISEEEYTQLIENDYTVVLNAVYDLSYDMLNNLESDTGNEYYSIYYDIFSIELGYQAFENSHIAIELLGDDGSAQAVLCLAAQSAPTTIEGLYTDVDTAAGISTEQSESLQERLLVLLNAYEDYDLEYCSEDTTTSETDDSETDGSQDDGSEETTTYPPFVEIVTYDETMTLGETQSIYVYYEETFEYDTPVEGSLLIEYESGDMALYVFDETSLDATYLGAGMEEWEIYFDFTPAELGEHTVTITIVDESGDEDSDSVTITVTEEDTTGDDDSTDDGSDDSSDDTSDDTTDDGSDDSTDDTTGDDDSTDDSESECEGSDAFCSLEEDIESLTSNFESYEEDYDDLEDDYDDARDDDDEEDLEDALDDLEGLKEDLEELLEDIEDLRDDIDDADDDDDITSSEEDDLSDMLDDLEDDVEDLIDDINDLIGEDNSNSVSADSWKTPTVVTSGSSSSDNSADDSTSTVDITRLNPTLPEDSQTSFEQSNSWEDMRYLAYLVAGIVVAFAALIFMIAVIATKKN